MFELDDDLMRQLRATFKLEAAEHIQAMNHVLLALEENPESDQRQALLEEIFREAHSLKGAAGAADLGEVEATSHKLESVFGAAKAGKIKLTHELCDVLYEGIDAVSTIVDAALEDRPHGIDLAELHQRLIAAEQGQASPRAKAHALAAPAPNEPATPDTPREEQPEAEASEPVQLVVEAISTAKAPAKIEPKAKAGKTETRKNNAATIDDTIRVTTSKIDLLMTQAGELLVAGLKIDQRLRDVDEIGHTIEDWNREWLKVRAANSGVLHESEIEALRPLMRLLDMSQEKLRQISAQVGDLRRGFARDALHLSRITNDLSEGVMKVRMLPVSTVFDAFPRMVRDLARDNGKEIELKMEGQETELDRKVLEAIKDPLLHLLRNAVDHGIEKPDERLKAGKPRSGTLQLSAYQKGNSIVIEVADDGAGINRHKVRQAALRAGLINVDEMEAMNDDAALRMIFAPGLSTRAIITDISGRGVGMDVVRKNVEALQGQVDVESTLGAGTTITLTLPLTLAATQELLVQVNDQTFGIPIAAVERIIRITPKDISAVEGRPAIVVDSEPMSMVKLAAVLEMPQPNQQTPTDEMQRVPVVILGTAKRRIAFLVDAVVGQQETVVKSLGKQLSRVRNVAGATILGTGQVIMTLNPSDLMKAARGLDVKTTTARRGPSPNGQGAKRPTVLVVDDSLSTRTLEKNILETAGYKVQVATDGLEAMSLLNSNGSVDVIVSDVLMPRMGGFELTQAVKSDRKLKKIPVILVTSLDSRADKERGIEVGADAYLVKSNFDQANLLDTIAQLI